MIIFIFSIGVVPGKASGIDLKKYTIIEDKEYCYSAPLPSNWKIKRSKDITSFWRISATSPDKKNAVAIFAFKGHNTIDLEKLSEADNKMFRNLGNVTNSSKIKRHYFWTKAILKNYSRNRSGVRSTGYFTIDGTYGYIILTDSLSGDFSIGSNVANNFKSDVPFLTNLKNWLPGEEIENSWRVYVSIAFCLFLAYLLFYFISRPSYKMLFAFLACSIVYFIGLNYFEVISPYLRQCIPFWYSISCYFILSFFFLNKATGYYADMVNFTIGWDELKIPIISWEDSDDFGYVNILGIPIWRPFSYIRKLRKYYESIDLTEYESSQKPFPTSISEASQIQVNSCKFIELLRADTKEKNGSCWLVFSGYNGKIFLYGYADRYLLLVKPMRSKENSYKMSYISRMGWAPKLNQQNSYDLFGKFSSISVEGKSVPGISLTAIRKHREGFSPNLFIHWISILFFLLLVIALWFRQ
jgi:hypothetical protein